VLGGHLRARGVAGLFPANRVDDDIEVYTDEGRRAVRAVFHTLRQQHTRSDRPNLALADFVAPTGTPDWIGAFMVTTGLGVEELVAACEADHDDYRAIMIKAVADRLAEAFAEHLHERVRRELWGYAPDERLTLQELVKERYAGIRPAPGYPSQPDHTEKRTLFDLVAAESMGVALTESCAMTPAASVSGLYFAHPDAKYFGVKRIGDDQLEDYARRKGWDHATAKRWLAPLL
jgi:5-methyltetrahydrofolate--homocysteine methyltransferase